MTKLVSLAAGSQNRRGGDAGGQGYELCHTGGYRMVQALRTQLPAA
jgi:hypothetical protein